MSTRSIIIQQVIFKGKEATGVEFVWKGETRQVSAKKEVILSAGAMGSPKLLMLSGVGPKDHLKEIQVKIKTILTLFCSFHYCSQLKIKAYKVF